jgi:putative transposase
MVIAPLLNRPLPRGVQEVMLAEIAGKMHYDVDGRLITVGKRTIERHLSNYRKFGLEGLKPQIREEKGALNAFPQEALEEAVKMREARPELSADSIIEELRSAEVIGAEQMNVSTLNRHLRRLSKDRPSLKRAVKKRYRLLSVEGAHMLWICDVWDGPYLFDQAVAKKRRLRLVVLLPAPVAHRCGTWLYRQAQPAWNPSRAWPYRKMVQDGGRKV